MTSYIYNPSTVEELVQYCRLTVMDYAEVEILVSAAMFLDLGERLLALEEKVK